MQAFGTREVTLSSVQKKQLLRLVIGGVYLAGMAFLYGSTDEVVWSSWIGPLLIAILVYNFILWLGRCPECREEFVLEPGKMGILYTTFICRHCGTKIKRITGGGGP